MKISLFIIVIWIIGCNQKKEKIFLTLSENNVTREGYATLDSIFIDTVFYYDSARRLLRKDVVANGKINGISTDYYSNGKPKAVTQYTHGLKNGNNLYFDRHGRCYYKDFYYYDLVVGPVLYLDSSGNPNRYFFVNLQNETLVDINYRTWTGIREINTGCINFTSQTQVIDSLKKVFILLYLLDPPRFSFNYSIVKRKDVTKDEFVDVMAIKNDFPFKNLVLPQLANKENYAVRLNVFDSILNKETVIFKDIY